MGVCSSIYIEFRKKDDKQWHLLSGVVPLEYVDQTNYSENASPDDNHIVEIGGVKMYQMFNLVRQGVVRDLLAGLDRPFSDRGFPDDLSSELKEMFDKVQHKIDARNEEHMYSSGDWRWRKSWCTLDEFESYVEESFEKCKARILAEHTKQLSNGISAKLDTILDIVSGRHDMQKYKTGEEREDDSYNMLEYYMEEELEEILCLKEFAAGIELIHEFLTGDRWSETSIRLVFYAC